MADGGPAARSPVWALAVIITLVGVVSGLATGRPDTVALAVPFALLALAGRGPGRTGEPPVRIGPDPRTAVRGTRLRLLIAPQAADAGSTRRLSSTVLAAPGRRSDALVLRADEECPVLVDAPPSGEQDVLSYGSGGFTADLVDPSPFRVAPPVRVSILPPTGTALPRPASRRLLGSTGTHAAGRPGEGGELRSIAPLQPADQRRRIDWRATARRSTDQDRIMVRRTFADAEASVLLVVDQGHDVPPSTADWFEAGPPAPVAGSLHVTRAAATTVAASYLAAGDRVGLEDLSGTRRALRSASGARQLEQIRVRLAGTVVVPRRRRRRDPVPPPGSVVMLFSTFLDAEPARLLRLWHARGHVVAGVDCVPPLARAEATTAQTDAVRITLLRRRLLLDDLRSEGIPVLSGTTGGPRSTTRRPGGPHTSDTPDTSDGQDLESGLRLLARRSRAGRGVPGSAGGTP